MSLSVRRIRILVAGTLVLAGSACLSGVSGADPGVPYTDANAVGSIGLCDQAGQQITSGNVNTKPFAWRAVSTQPAPAPYNNSRRTAILLAFQPLQGLPPGDWSGAELTSSSYYSNPANPMAAATTADQSLEDIIEQYPPRWDGFLQLRIYLGTADHQAYTASYPALNIQVTGDTWSAVGGSTVNCDSGSAESIESLVLPSTTTTTPTTTATTGSTSKPAASGSGTSSTGTSGGPGASSHGSGSGSGSATTKTDSGSDVHPRNAVVDSTESTTSKLLIVVVIVVALLVLGALAHLFVRRRRVPSSASGSSVATTSSARGARP